MAEGKNIIKLKIDGKPVEVEEGTTILEAADLIGIKIPRLCHDKRLKPFGACRLCIVEIEGRGSKFVTACSTPVEPNISVITSNPRIDRARKTVMELLAVHHPIDCPVCDAAGECQMQILTTEIRGIEHRRFEGKEKNIARDARNPLIERNLNRCVGCGKCVRVCSEVQGTSAIDFQYRGFSTKIGSPFGEPLDCDFCGQCVDICPVGALLNRQYKFTTRAWFLKKGICVCPYCGDGCVIEIGVGSKGQIVRGKSAPEAGYNEGNLCQRGRFGHDFLQNPLRLQYPMVRRNGELKRTDWNQVIEMVSTKLMSNLSKLSDKGEGKIGFMIGGRIDNEALGKLKILIKSLGERVRVSSSSMSKLRFLKDVVEKVWGTQPPLNGAERALRSDFILVLDSEINATNPFTWINVHKAKLRHGAKLVTVSTRRTKTGRRSDKFYYVEPGGCTELLMRVASKVLRLSGGRIPEANPENFEGFEKFVKELSGIRAVLTKDIADSEIEWIANEMVRAKDPLVVFTLDASENMKSKQFVIAVANLLLLLGKGPENMLVPLPESNTRGLIESGVLGKDWGDDPASMLNDIKNGKIKVLYVIGDDPISKLPESSYTRQVLSGLELFVVQDIILSGAASIADVVLPVAGWAEHRGSYTSSEGKVQFFEKMVEPPKESLSDEEIIERILESAGIKREVSEKPEAPPEKKGALHYSFIEVQPIISIPSGGSGDEFILVTGPGRGHNGVLSTYSQAITSVFPEPYLFINPDDAMRLGISDMETVNLKSYYGEVGIRVKIDDQIKKGTVYVPCHFSEPPVLDLISNDVNLSGAPVKVKVIPFHITKAATISALS